MADNYYDNSWTEKVTLPIKRVLGKWEFLYGGDIPVKEGSIGELTLSTQDITDDKFKQRVTQEVIVRILNEGTELCVALSDRSENSRRHLGRWPEKIPDQLPPGTTRIERVTLGPVKKKKTDKQLDLTEVDGKGGLWLKVKGLERCELQGSTVLMPEGFAEASAISLNHAFTLLSERYETHRLSHTGNVYERFFYEESDGRWYPLDDLRQGVLVAAERKLMASAWEELERVLGFRPVPTAKQRK